MPVIKLNGKEYGVGSHVIKDESGTALTQRTNLQFGKYVHVTDDSTNDATIIDTEPEEVEWSVWQTMSDADKADKHWIILNAPDTTAEASQIGYNNASSGLSAIYVQDAIDELAGIVLRNQTLNFSGNTATIANANVTSDTLFYVFYHDPDEAGRCSITAEGSTNLITFTILDTPANPIVCDIIIKQ